jgi:hypothetical protein
MAVSEPDRHELYQAFEGLMGKKKAETRMALLPPTGWGDVATRRDLDGIHQRLDAIQRELDNLEVETAHKRDLEALESRFNERLMRTALTVNIPSILSAVGLSFAATRLG